jgi:transcriptional regulator NrdR family protein
MATNQGFGNGPACPQCQSIRSSIRDKRNVDGITWRNRVCDHNHKYRTVESVETPDAEKARTAVAKEREVSAQFKKDNTIRRKYLKPEPVALPPKDQEYIDKLLAKSSFKELSETIYDL